jgi:hypothetical protein
MGGTVGASQGGSEGEEIRLVYSNGDATTLKDVIYLKKVEAPAGWLSLMTDLDNNLVNTLSEIKNGTDDKNFSEYIIRVSKNVPFAAIKSKNEKAICNSEAELTTNPTSSPPSPSPPSSAATIINM